MTGWWFAKAANQSGIVSALTNALDAKTSGSWIGNEAAWALSAFATESPTSANTQESAKPKASRR